MKNSWRVWLINLTALILFGLDRAIKKIFFAGGGEYFVFSDFFRLQLAINPGLAFSLKINNLVLLFLSAVVLVILVWFLIKFYRRQKYFLVFGFTLILFGAFSNFLDRLYHGAVIDYLEVKNFTVFNLADAMIVIGAGMLLVKSLKIKNCPPEADPPLAGKF